MTVSRFGWWLVDMLPYRILPHLSRVLIWIPQYTNNLKKIRRFEHIYSNPLLSLLTWMHFCYKKTINRIPCLVWYDLYFFNYQGVILVFYNSLGKWNIALSFYYWSLIVLRYLPFVLAPFVKRNTRILVTSYVDSIAVIKKLQAARDADI